MVEPNSPAGPGRSTSEAAINELKKDIARRNEEAQKAARKKRVGAREGASCEPTEAGSALNLPHRPQAPAVGLELEPDDRSVAPPGSKLGGRRVGAWCLGSRGSTRLSQAVSSAKVALTVAMTSCSPASTCMSGPARA